MKNIHNLNMKIISLSMNFVYMAWFLSIGNKIIAVKIRALMIKHIFLINAAWNT